MHYREKPPLLAGYYSYWSGLPTDGRFETYIRDRRAFAAMPTHDDLTLVIAGWPYAEFAENKRDIEGNYLKAIEQAPDFAKRLRNATAKHRSPARRCRTISQALRPRLGARGRRRLLGIS